MTETTYPVYGEITGPIVMIGFGSIGRGTLPLIERHFEFDKSRMVVIDPRDDADHTEIMAKHGVKHIKSHVTKDNYKDLLKPLLTEGGGQGLCVNLSVDTGSVDLMRLCRKLDVLYIDTVVEPWAGFYFDQKLETADRTNYALRETFQGKAEKPRRHHGRFHLRRQPWHGLLVRQARAARICQRSHVIRRADQQDREEWAKLMQKVGVKGIHIAERDTQRPTTQDDNVSEIPGRSKASSPKACSRQNLAGAHENGCRKWAQARVRLPGRIYLQQPGANTRVRSWCPTSGWRHC